MRGDSLNPKDIDQYISFFPKDVQTKLKEMRATIQKAAPKAEEAISYMMPTFRLYGNLVHFAAFKNHIGFYPGPAGIVAFQNELKGFETSKGTIQFPLDKPLPLKLVAAITKFRTIQNMEKAEAKKKRQAN